MQCTVVIPVIKPNDLLSKVVKNTLLTDKNLKIIIVYNVFSKIIESSERVELLQTTEKNMSSKRNFGVKKSTTEYIAFLDSDAYPDKDWFKSAKKLLENNSSIGIITGPELSFPDQTFIENTVGICNRSFLILGSHSFRKSISKSRFYSEASGCNIILKKKDYMQIDGMDPKLYLGEDKEFSHRFVKELKKKIYFSNNVKIFHKDRGLVGYIVQRYARGLTAVGLIDKIRSFIHEISINNFIKQRFELFMPFTYIIFLLSTPFVYFSKIWMILFLITNFLYLFIIFIETIRLTKNKFAYFFPVFIFLIIGSLTPGLAPLFKLLNINMNIKKLYRNS